jgi:hypothetical protein
MSSPECDRGEESKNGLDQFHRPDMGRDVGDGEQHLALEWLEEGASLVAPLLEDGPEICLRRRWHVKRLVGDLLRREDKQEVGTVVALDHHLLGADSAETTQIFDHLI